MMLEDAIRRSVALGEL